MRSGYTTIRSLIVIIIVLVVFLFGLFPISQHEESGMIKANNAFPASNSRITIGNGVTRTTYYLFQNLTVMPGSKLVVNDTNLILVGEAGSVMSIDDYGSAWFNDSVISTSTINGAGNLTLDMNIGNGSMAGFASLFTYNSTLGFHGSLNIVHSTARFLSSAIGMQNSSSPSIARSLSIKGLNSTIYSYNTTYGGLYHRSAVSPYVNGYLNAPVSGTSGSFGEVGYNMITFTYGNVTAPTAYDDSIILNLTFSGNDSNGLDFINVMANGTTIENYTFPSTGGDSILESVSIPVNLSVPVSQASAYSSSGFTAWYGLNANTRTEIKNIEITLLSNDTEARYGTGMFNIILHNSTYLSIRDNLSLGFQHTFTTGKILNPEKNMLILNGNSTAYLVSDEYNNGTYVDTPFMVSNHSSVTLYTYEKLKFSTPNGRYVNGTPSVMPAMISTRLSAIAALWNRDLSTMIGDSGFSLPLEHDGEFIFPLADSLLNSSNNLTYVGDYSVRMAGITSYFSVPPFPASIGTNVIQRFNLNLPNLSLFLDTKSVTVGNSPLNLTIVSTGTVALRNITLDIAGFAETTNLIGSHLLMLGSETPMILRESYSIPVSAQPGNYVATVTVKCNNYTLEGKNFSMIYHISVEPSISITVSNFSATSSGNEIEAYFLVSNLGLNTASYVLHSRMISSGGYSYTLTRLLVISPGSKYPVSLTFNTSQNVTAFNLCFSPETTGGQSYNITINQSVAIQVTKNPVVTFVESGLPHYTVWSVSVENITSMGFGESQNISLPEGNYTAIITPYNGNFSGQTVNFSVSLKNSTVIVNFVSPVVKLPAPAYNIEVVYDASGIAAILLATFGVIQWRSLSTYYVCTACMKSYRRRLLHRHRHDLHASSRDQHHDQ